MGGRCCRCGRPLGVPTLPVTNGGITPGRRATQAWLYHDVLQGTRILAQLYAHGTGRQGKKRSGAWHFEERGGRRAVWRVSSHPSAVTPHGPTPSLFSYRLDIGTADVSARPVCDFCLAIIFYLSITCCSLLLRSQELSWHGHSLKQLWKLLSSPAWGFRPFSLNIYIGTTCWNMQVYTEKALKLEKAASSTPSICFLAAVERSQNTGLEGVQTETAGTW